MSDKTDELNDLIDDLEKEVKKLVDINGNMIKTNDNLRDEIESLWMMMDEMAKTDTKSWSGVMEDLKLDIATRTLMATKKKAEC
jgi:cell division septum initiation protein DivIVA